MQGPATHRLCSAQPLGSPGWLLTCSETRQPALIWQQHGKELLRFGASSCLVRNWMKK